MPRAPKHCGIQGCQVVVPSGQRCPDHRHGWSNTNRRESKASNTQHKAWRQAVLERDHWRCQLRYPGICIGTASIADHIQATKFGGPEYDIRNGQAACRPCSDRKSSAEGHAAQGHAIRDYRGGGAPPPGRAV